jgi:hypothetical protein
MANGAFSTEYTSLILNGHPFTNFINGDTIELTPVNPLSSRQQGKDVVSIIKRSDSGTYDMIIRLLRGSNDDIFMNTLVNQPSVAILEGSLIENYTNSEAGVNSTEAWKLNTGSITTLPKRVVNNVDNNVLMEYTIQFSFCVRTI